MDLTVRLAMLVAVSLLLAAACSSPVARPVAFDNMTTDEVGCTVKYGDDIPYVVGPLGTGDSWDVEPNDWTSFRIGRTALDVFVVAKNPRSESHTSEPLNDLPADGVVARDALIDGGNPGYVITCWRGSD